MSISFDNTKPDVPPQVIEPKNYKDSGCSLQTLMRRMDSIRNDKDENNKSFYIPERDTKQLKHRKYRPTRKQLTHCPSKVSLINHFRSRATIVSVFFYIEAILSRECHYLFWRRIKGSRNNLDKQILVPKEHRTTVSQGNPQHIELIANRQFQPRW